MGLCECGGNCPKYLKREWNRKQGRENKDFKKGGGQAESRSGYYIVSIAKTTSSIIGTLIRYEVSFF